jgi:hypothetical protein
MEIAEGVLRAGRPHVDPSGLERRGRAPLAAAEQV